MPISISSTNLLPLGDEPTRISVRVSRDLFKSLDPSMESLEEGDSFTRVLRKGKAAINQIAREVGIALFGAESAPLSQTFGWSKFNVMGPNGPMMVPYQYIGICFDHHVAADNANPKVLELVADEELDGGAVILRAKELDAAERDDINMKVNREE